MRTRRDAATMRVSLEVLQGSESGTTIPLGYTTSRYFPKGF